MTKLWVVNLTGTGVANSCDHHSGLSGGLDSRCGTGMASSWDMKGRKQGGLKWALSAEVAALPCIHPPGQASSTTCSGVSTQDSTKDDRQGSASRCLSWSWRVPEGANRPTGRESGTPSGWPRTFSPGRACPKDDPPALFTSGCAHLRVCPKSPRTDPRARAQWQGLRPARPERPEAALEGSASGQRALEGACRPAAACAQDPGEDKDLCLSSCISRTKRNVSTGVPAQPPPESPEQVGSWVPKAPGTLPTAVHSRCTQPMLQQPGPPAWIPQALSG